MTSPHFSLQQKKTTILNAWKSKPASQFWENMVDSRYEPSDYSDIGNTVGHLADHLNLENMSDSLGNGCTGQDWLENMAGCGKSNTMLKEMAGKELLVGRGSVVLMADQENIAGSLNCQGESIGVGFSFVPSHESPAARNVVMESLGSTSYAKMVDVEVMQDMENTPNVALAVDSNVNELVHTESDPVVGLAQGAQCHPTTKTALYEKEEIIVVNRVHAVSILEPLSVAQLGANIVIGTGAVVTMMRKNILMSCQARIGHSWDQLTVAL